MNFLEWDDSLVPEFPGWNEDCRGDDLGTFRTWPKSTGVPADNIGEHDVALGLEVAAVDFQSVDSVPSEHNSFKRRKAEAQRSGGRSLTGDALHHQH